MTTVTVNASKTYDIKIGSGLLSSLPEELQKLGVVFRKCLPIGSEAFDISIQLKEQVFFVFQEQLRPHAGIQPGDPSQIPVASGGETLVPKGSGGLDEGIAQDVGHLGGKGDHLIMRFGSGDGKVTEAAGRQHLFDPVQQQDIIENRGDQHHRLSFKEIGPAVFEAGILAACHGMSADKGKSILLGKGEAAAADDFLGAAAVQNQGFPGNVLCMFLQPGCAALGIDRQQDQITAGDGCFVQGAMNGTGQHGKGMHTAVFFRSINGMPFQGIGPGQRAANEAEAENSNGHTIASRIL